MHHFADRNDSHIGKFDVPFKYENHFLIKDLIMRDEVQHKPSTVGFHTFHRIALIRAASRGTDPRRKK